MMSSTPDGRWSRSAVAQPPPPTTTARPHIWEFVLHPLKSLHFVGALARDPRISAIRKFVYVTIIGVLVVALVVPDGLIALLVATLLPFVGPFVAVPADATVDWLFLGTVSFALLGLFPAHLVREHHARIFHPHRNR